MAKNNNNVINNNVNNNNVINNNAPRQTTLQGLVSTLDCPLAYYKKVLNDALKSADVDTAALRWHLDAVGMKVWGDKCVTYANAEKSALIISVAEKSGDKAEKGTGSLDALFGLIDNAKANADALTSATKKTTANAAAVALTSSAVDALKADADAFRQAVAKKAEKDAEKAKKVHEANVDALLFIGLEADAAEKAADTIRVVKGRKASNGLYCFKWSAVARSFDYTFADALKAARQAAAEKAAADKANADALKAEKDANDKAEKDAEKAAEKARKEAEKAEKDAAALRTYNVVFAAVRPMLADDAAAEKSALASLTKDEARRVRRQLKDAKDAEKVNEIADALNAIGAANTDKVVNE